MEQSLRDDINAERMGKVTRIDGWVDGGVGRCDVDGSARERMFGAG